MRDGREPARRAPADPGPRGAEADDVLTRFGLVAGGPPAPGGRAERRRAAENRAAENRAGMPYARGYDAPPVRPDRSPLGHPVALPAAPGRPTVTPNGRPPARSERTAVLRGPLPGGAERTAVLRGRAPAPRGPGAGAPPRGPRADDSPTTPIHLPDPAHTTAAGIADDQDGQAGARPDDGDGGSADAAATERARRIDRTLTRLTAAHAGIVLQDDGDDGDDGDAQDADGQDGAGGDAPRPGRRATLLRALAAAAVAVLLLATGLGWATQTWLGSGLRTVSALDPGSGAIADAAAQRGAENALVVATSGHNPDTVVVAHVPAPGGPLTALTIPTDLQVSRPPCDRWDPVSAGYTATTVPAEANSSIASALAQGGPRCVTRVVQQLTGLAVTRYVGLDLDALGAGVDAVAGVSVCTPRPVVDARLGPLAPAAGTVALTGHTATDFVHAAAVAGDPPGGQARVQRQQQVLAAVLSSALTDHGLLDVARVGSVRSALAGALVTDQTDPEQVLALARGLATGGVTFRVTPSAPAPQGAGTAPADADAKALFAALRTGAPLPPAPATAAAAPAPAQVDVDVLNGSDRTGQAAQVGTTLRGLGFTVGKVAGADRPSADTVIRYSPDQTAAADLLAASVPSATTVADPGAHGELQLVLGRSFDSVIKPPTTAAAPAPTPAATTSCP